MLYVHFNVTIHKFSHGHLHKLVIETNTTEQKIVKLLFKPNIFLLEKERKNEIWKKVNEWEENVIKKNDYNDSQQTANNRTNCLAEESKM